MRAWRVVPLLFIALLSRAATTYISQSGGSVSCGSYGTQTTQSLSWFNSTSPINISAGNTYAFCGTFTITNGATGVAIRASGTVGNTIVLDGSQATLTAGYSSTVNGLLVTTGQNYLRITGFTYQNTDNGSALGNQQASQGFVITGSHDVEVDHNSCINLYQHTLSSDHTIGGDSTSCVFAGGYGPNIKIHDNSMHDSLDGINLQGPSASGSVGLAIYNNTGYHMDHAINLAVANVNLTGVDIYNNHFWDAVNWDTAVDKYHHNGGHLYALSPNTGIMDGSVNPINIYNNQITGDYGVNVTTDGFYFEGTRQYVNFIGNYMTTTNPTGANNGCSNPGGDHNVVVNNTCIGPSNVAGLGFVLQAGLTSDPNNPHAFSNLVFQNNIVDYVTQAITNGNTTPASTFTANDHNRYGTHLGAIPWQWLGTNYITLAAYQAACSCDVTGTSNAALNVDANGLPTSQMLGIDLTSSNYTGWTPDAVGTIRASPVTQGAYQLSGSPSCTLTVTPSVVQYGDTLTIGGNYANVDVITLTNVYNPSVTLSGGTISGTAIANTIGGSVVIQGTATGSSGPATCSAAAIKVNQRTVSVAY